MMWRILAAIFAFIPVSAQNLPNITTPKQALGFNLGDDYSVASYTQLESYWKTLASQCDRCKLIDIGPTAEGRRQVMMIVTSPENLKRLDRYKQISARLAHAEGLTDNQAHALAREGKAVVWIDGGLHASETVGSQQLMEMVYQMASRTDPETIRFLNDVIGLYVPANPDGQEFVAKWYMREKDPRARTLSGLPRLYAKYVGHDDNRDFYMSNMPETTNMNRQLFLEWFPQIVYDHHQTGPAGAVVFMPPFRDPFNYNFDPLVPLEIDMAGAAMHSRLVEEGKGGSAMRSGSNYSTWWNGGLRTITYFHNMIGLLTEIIGNPTPIDIPLVAGKQLPQGDWPLPIAPTIGGQKWHYRQSIDYDITNNRAILDLASRYRETFLYNIYLMGRNSIEKGGRDNWTVTPKRIAALEQAAVRMPTGGPQSAGGARAIPSELYNTVLHDPKLRDPRGYVIPADQPDFATATEFVNALLKNGIAVLKANRAFQVEGKNYPSGSYVVKTAQAFRPHVMDMFEPQDHPNDFAYPGGPPKRPYDITGWTLALQMGVKFDRILDGFDGPFSKIDGLLAPPEDSITGTGSAGYLISHQINNSFILINRLLKAGAEVYWLNGERSAGGENLGTGAIWVPESAAARRVLARGAKQLGVPVHAVAAAPEAGGLKLKPIRIGLYDRYGGIISSGWTRWLFEQYEFPFQVVYPRTLDAGDLKSKFDVLVFTDGAYRRGGFGGRGGGVIDPESVPEEYRASIGRISEDRTIPQLKKFVQAGGSIVTIGSSTAMTAALGVPVENYLTALPPEKFYIPGSLLKANIDNTSSLGFGMPREVDLFFDNSPVFRIDKTMTEVARFSGQDVLDSGWAWGQQYLDGATAVAEVKMGEGQVILFGPEITFRAQSHAAFKLLFNGLYSGSARDEPEVR